MCNPATPALAYCVTVRATFAGPPNLQRRKYNTERLIMVLRCSGDCVPCIGVCDDWDCGVEAANHLCGLDRVMLVSDRLFEVKLKHPNEVVHRRNGKIRLAETRSCGGGTAENASKDAEKKTVWETCRPLIHAVETCL